MDMREQRMDMLEQRVDMLEQRVDRIDGRLGGLMQQMIEVVRAVEGTRADFRLEINHALLRANRTTVQAMAGTIVRSSTLALVVMATFGA